MERTIGIEEARGRLGELAKMVCGADAVVLAKRGRACAVQAAEASGNTEFVDARGWRPD